jgi:hypothetical protein
MAKMRFSRRGPAAVAMSLLLMLLPMADHVQSGPRTTLHYAANHNFDVHGRYLPSKAGFNLADVASAKQLRSLPEGVMGLVWLGKCNGVDETFLEAMRPYVGSRKLFGIYLMDDPDPTGHYFPLCTAENLKLESDWIHANMPGVVTFIVLMNMATTRFPVFMSAYAPATSHVDLFGLHPYPCRTELRGCDYDMIDRFIAAAETWGIPRDRIVPVYQAFGEGLWSDGGGGKYIVPTADQENEMLARWEALIETPVFDFVYSWGSQREDRALENSPELQMVFSRHNGIGSPAK